MPCVRWLLRAVILLALPAVAGCAGGRYVTFGEQIERTRRPTVHSCESGTRIDTWDPRVVRVYFDRDGSLYPGHDVRVPLSDAVFQGDPSRPLRDVYERTIDAGFDPYWSPVRADLRLPPRAPWAVLQDSIRARAARRVAGALAYQPGSLVVLVHGFNVDDAECDFAYVRQRLEAAAPAEMRQAVFLQVSWDGLRASPPLSIWTNAQFHFPLVGQGLRRLLTDPAFPRDGVAARFLGHSSGNPVIAHALWDASAAEQVNADECQWRAYREYLDARLAGRLPSPPRFADLRVGMIVPAGPESLFHFFDPEQTHLDRLVIGVNHADYAVSKGRLTCGAWGNSCLAVRPRYACAVRDRFLGSRTNTFGFDFSGYRGPRWSMVWAERHDFDLYARRPQFPAFARALLTDTHPADDFADSCRGVRPKRPPAGESPHRTNQRAAEACRATGWPLQTAR